jgi:uncharacterized DUF497 family protein
MEFEWDPQKAISNFKKHRVHFADAVTVFSDDRALTMEDPQPDEERFITLGMDAQGNILVISCTWREDRIRIISARKATPAERRQYERWDMKKEYDFSNAKRGALDPLPKGKTRITIRIDDDVLTWFKNIVESQGGGNYQTLINHGLREYINAHGEPLEEIVRRLVREEMKRVG